MCCTRPLITWPSSPPPPQPHCSPPLAFLTHVSGERSWAHRCVLMVQISCSPEYFCARVEKDTLAAFWIRCRLGGAGSRIPLHWNHHRWKSKEANSLGRGGADGFDQHPKIRAPPQLCGNAPSFTGASKSAAMT